jgi:N-formylglutamate deformylase
LPTARIGAGCSGVAVEDEDTAIFRVEYGDGPVIATAIHDGHALRSDVASRVRLSDAERLREEDPFTATWTGIGDTRVIVLRSRFEVDLNRPRDQAVYRSAAEAWGNEVWIDGGPPMEAVARSLAEYDLFYAAMRSAFEATIARCGMFVVYDLHSYNHCRDGEPADPREHPVINLGTGSLDRRRWGAVAERFLHDIRGCGIGGLPIDARENVKFRGGWLTHWIHETFPDRGCALAIEVKKVYMDEDTGVPDWPAVRAIGLALASTVPGVVEEIRSELREAA